MAGRTKGEYRTAALAARRALPEDVRRTESMKLSEHLAGVVRGSTTVCAYWPVGQEPGSPDLLDRLAGAGVTVLLPVAALGADGEPRPLGWGEYRPGSLVEGLFGIREPAGPALGPEAIATSDLVLVPALAVARDGVRLGRGAGFYDRTLPLCAPGTRLVAVVRDAELVDGLPREPHDVLMTHALTPAAGLVRLGDPLAVGTVEC